MTDPEIGILREQNSIEDYLKMLWERVRTAGEMIRELRSEKQSLGSRVGELERDLLAVKNELQQRDQELKRLRAERAQLLVAGGNAGFSEEEREALKGKIHDLISKINSHL